MSITYKYDLTFIGLGDLTFFCGEMLLRLKKEDVLMVRINKFTLDSYRGGSESYKNFCIEYIKYILSDYTVLECGHDVETDRTWGLNLDYVNRMLSEPNIRNVFKTKFSPKVNTDNDNYVVLFTKVREYDRNMFNNLSKEFYMKLNSMNYKIVIMGEKKVIYDGEYGLLGKNIVYSLYDDFISNISSEKIIDLTKDDYSPNNISLENILNDLSLISNSKKMILIGCGGFFCTTLFTDKLLSLSSNNICRQFNSELNTQVFFDHNVFLQSLNYV